MGIKKKVITEVTFVCDNSKCGKEGDKEGDFVIDLPVMKGAVKDKIVLCKPCATAHNEFMARYFGDEVSGQTPGGDYDPHTYPQLKNMAPAERERHYKAKLWALSPKSTLPLSSRPEGVKGKAGPKVLEAYEAYLKDLAEIDAGIAAANGKTVT